MTRTHSTPGYVPVSGPRDKRRRRTESLILTAARNQFGRLGYERTTIRSVAAGAGVDPALVMRHFGTKEGLFAASAGWHVDSSCLAEATLEQLPHAVLEDMLTGMGDPERRSGALALIRNCLTHDRARDMVRDVVVLERRKLLARAITSDDCELRAELLSAMMIGVMIARYLFEIPSVAHASVDAVERVLEPALRELTNPRATHG